MRKLFIISTSIFILYGCSWDIRGNNSSSSQQINYTVPHYTENAITSGINNINYDTSKTLNTVFYYAQSPATDEYTKSTTYSVTANNQPVGSQTTIVNSKTALTNYGPKEIIIDMNRNIQEYNYKNNIHPISNRESNTALYRTMPVIVDNGTAWNNIWVLNTTNDTYSQINATCIAVSKYAYFFLENGLTQPSNEIMQEITTAFDKDYEIVLKYYGTPEDTDGNGKVSFLISNLNNDRLFGFFFSPDKYKQSIYSTNKSNEADVLYINYNFFKDTATWNQYKTDVLATFIHEFQHMVLFDSRSRNNLSPNINTWINEGLSMLAEYYGGYAGPHYYYLKAFFTNNQGKSLITDDSSVDYGLSYLFARYLQIRFGDGFIQKIYNSSYTGIQAVEEATGEKFETLFLDFVKMILVTGRNITTDTRYNIAEFNYTQGTEGYTQNGFNLAEIIDEVYSLNSSNTSFISSNGYSNKNLALFSFFITKWNGPVTQIELTDNNTAGMYQAW